MAGRRERREVRVEAWVGLEERSWISEGSEERSKSWVREMRG
jgi:hypothetical protein